MTPVRAQARRAGRALGVLGATAGIVSAYAVREPSTPEADRQALRDRHTRVWCDAMLRMFGIDLLVLGEADHADKVPSRRARLVVANHRGMIDVVILMRGFGGALLSRADVAGWPLIGWGARKAGTLFVDRQSSSSRAGAIRVMRNALREGRTVTVFPEGTTFEGDEVRPFHAGAFLAALRSEVDVIPVGIAYPRGSGAAFLDESVPEHLARLAASPGSTVVMAVGAAIPADGETAAGPLCQKAREAVAREVARAREACDRVARNA